ncbi:hypothetical protein GCM10025868_21590 [Angustibacter aerolatus]|uniref:MarR family transcriptional regulator n=1 Tax=Angustibacter aerolatus TaxID=1162965 RepID=A0ABQ6JGJ3_9ACTN|nr:hypothetical protein GCM10025868_21590 [Angustibacter aerolatus]
MQRPADVDHVDEADVLRIQSELGLLFRRARSRARRAAEEIHPGLTQPAYVVLARVVEHGSTRASELVEPVRHRQGRGQPPGHDARAGSGSSSAPTTPPTVGRR